MVSIFMLIKGFRALVALSFSKMSKGARLTTKLTAQAVVSYKIMDFLAKGFVFIVAGKTVTLAVVVSFIGAHIFAFVSFVLFFLAIDYFVGKGFIKDFFYVLLVNFLMLAFDYNLVGMLIAAILTII